MCFYGVLKSIRTLSLGVGRVNSLYLQKEINLLMFLIWAKTAALKAICFIHPRDVLFLMKYGLFCADTTISWRIVEILFFVLATFFSYTPMVSLRILWDKSLSVSGRECLQVPLCSSKCLCKFWCIVMSDVNMKLL